MKDTTITIDIGIGESDRADIAAGLSHLHQGGCRRARRRGNDSTPRHRARDRRSHISRCFQTVGKAGDEATADLLTQRIQLHEKTAWMLRSMLEN